MFWLLKDPFNLWRANRKKEYRGNPPESGPILCIKRVSMQLLLFDFGCIPTDIAPMLVHRIQGWHSFITTLDNIVPRFARLCHRLVSQNCTSRRFSPAICVRIGRDGRYIITCTRIRALYSIYIWNHIIGNTTYLNNAELISSQPLFFTRGRGP